MNTRLFAATLLAAALATSGAALAADTGTASPPSNLKTVSAMFAFADQNHDGQLTRAEAKGHLPVTASQFETIDQAQRGWISFEQFVAFTNRRAGQQADAVLQVGSWH
ncbi:MAG: EF-hand domain-containing protein [Rubrivivax sp.]|nr:EF-hand domain-containing protein [Rubrivivax sp.]